jgi:membrane-bound lytic murein transglycosylase D
MIESAYNPHAYSRMHAAGIWQFIPSTGNRYGLQQDRWYDGRRDVLSATRAALDYLQFLHSMFGDWQLALAAYNWGEGSVQRAMARNRAARKPATYASLTMPEETRNYLLKLQALKNVFSNPDKAGIALQAVPNRPYLATVKAPRHIDVVKAAQLADMSVEELRSLNAGYRGPVIIRAAVRDIVLPIDKVQAFNANLENNKDPLATWEPYIVKRGETLHRLARKFSINVPRLQEANSLRTGERIQPGEMLLVPSESRGNANNVAQFSCGSILAEVASLHFQDDLHMGCTFASQVSKGDGCPNSICPQNSAMAQLVQ